MFRFLNRCLRAVIWGFWIAMAVLVWSQREHARPLVDYYVLWQDLNWTRPPELPRMSGTVTKVLGEGIVQVRTPAGVAWNLGQQGHDTNGIPVSREGLQFVAENRRLFGEHLMGREVQFAFTQTNAVLRTGLGFLYTDATNSVLAHFVKEGRWSVKPTESRLLPLREQYELRVGERRAREAALGRWAPAPAP